MWQDYDREYVTKLIESGQTNSALDYCLSIDNEELYIYICEKLVNSNITWDLQKQVNYVNFTYGWHDYKEVKTIC